MVSSATKTSKLPVTPFGDMALMKHSVDSTGIRGFLRTLDLPKGDSNRAYDAVQIIETFWLGIWAGASRDIHCDWPRQNKTGLLCHGSLVALRHGGIQSVEPVPTLWAQ